MTKFRNRKDPNRGNAALASAIDSADIPALIANLAGADSLARQQAREFLVDIGEPAVPALIGALKDKNENMREAGAVALGGIGPAAKAAVPALISALKDSSHDVRWRASEGTCHHVSRWLSRRTRTTPEATRATEQPQSPAQWCPTLIRLRASPVVAQGSHIARTGYGVSAGTRLSLGSPGKDRLRAR